MNNSDLDWLVKCRQCKHCYQVKAEADEVRCRLKECRYEPSDEVKALEQQSCDDCMSRKDIYFKLTNGAYPNETIEQFIDRLVKELDALPSVQPTQKWIPVKERLPKSEEDIETSEDISKVFLLGALFGCFYMENDAETLSVIKKELDMEVEK